MLQTSAAIAEAIFRYSHFLHGTRSVAKCGGQRGCVCRLMTHRHTATSGNVAVTAAANGRNKLGNVCIKEHFGLRSVTNVTSDSHV